MYQIELSGFRCFDRIPPVEIRPMTFLVGENSAGKTSFLAGARYLLQAFSPASQNPFNRDPYFLGGFEQIAHRQARGGVADNFSLSIRMPPNGRLGRGRKPTTTATHSFVFGRGSPQPTLDSYRMITGDLCAEFSFSAAIPQLNISQNNEPIFIPKNLLKDSPPSSLIRENSAFIGIIINGVHYGLESMKRNLPAMEGRPEKLPAIEQTHPLEYAISVISNSFRDANRALGQYVFASAPVRTQPLRTYTPSELIASSEGSHVPLELARAKRRSADEWKGVKRGLVEFGKNSGLFSDIEIRALGKSDVDPFQILVKATGPAMNIMDVGYGISQVIPIVYQLQNSGDNATFLLQQPEVHLHPRAQAELGTLMCQLLGKKMLEMLLVETHSDYLIDRVRIEVDRGRIPSGDVTILFFERNRNGCTITNLYLNDRGEIIDAPRNFRDFFIEEHSRLLGI
jgi:hypothetical protein